MDSITSIPNEETNYFFLLPDEIKLEIFSYLSPAQLPTCFLVCRDWRILKCDIWKKALEKNGRQDAIDDFSPLVEQDFMSWNEVFRLSRLSNLFSKTFEYKYNHSYEFFDESELVYSFIIRGDLIFYIANSIDIKIKRRGKKGETLLPGEKEKHLTHISLDGKYLFCLREDGKIIQWDYNQKKIIQEIQADDSGKEIFYAENGYIVFGSADIFELTLTIIPYQNPVARKYLKGIEILGTEGVVIRNEDLHLVAEDKISIYNLRSLDKLKTIDLNIRKHVQKNFCNGKRHQWVTIILIKNLFIGVEADKVLITDTNTSKIIGEVDDLFNFKDFLLNTQSLKKLVNICREHLVTSKSLGNKNENT